MGKKSILKVHEALQRKEQKERNREFSRILAEDIVMKAVDEAVACKLVTVLLALREKGWGKSRADWLINRSYEYECMVPDKASWQDLIQKMFDEYGYKEGEFGGNVYKVEQYDETGQADGKNGVRH